MKTSYKKQQFIAMIAVFTLTASVAFAWTAPTAAPTGGNVPAPINTGSVAQTKNASLSIIGNILASNGILGNLVNGIKGRFGFLDIGTSTGDIFIARPSQTGPGLSIGNDGKIIASSSGNISSGNFGGLVVDPNGGTTLGSRTNWVTKGLSITPTGQSIFQGPGVSIMSPLNISSGNPGVGKVLTSDAQGNATWQASTAGITGNPLTVSIADAGDVKVYRTSWYNNNTTKINQGYAICQPGYMAISGGVDCESNGSTMADDGNVGRRIDRVVHAMQISEPGLANGSPYPYTGTGSGNSTETGVYPTSWRGRCGAGNASDSELDMHITVVCMKVKQATLATTSDALTDKTDKINFGTGATSSISSNLDWYDISKTTGTNGQTCQSWLAGYPNFTGNPSTVRATGTLGPTTGTGSVPIGSNENCAYSRTISGVNYCYIHDYASKATITINGSNFDLAPTASCSGIVLNFGGSGNSVQANFKTQIYY